MMTLSPPMVAEEVEAPVKERPILFQGEMVRALLAGTKTQTRRAIKRTGSRVWQHQFPSGVMGWKTNLGHAFGNETALLCPYGEPGDRLWVRESWGYFDPDGSGDDYDSDTNDDGGAGPCKAYRDEMMQEGHPLRNYWRRRIAYRATWEDGRYGNGVDGPKLWRPSIHMPRWASRITLEITGVRVEPLQAISDADAAAEGCPCYVCGKTMDGRSEDDCHCFHRHADARDYRDLWDSINGAPVIERDDDGREIGRHWVNWDANPWVWVVEFRRIAQ